MKLAGVLPILAPPSAVAAALHDAGVLHRMLPACQAVEPLGPGRFRARIARKVGLLTLRIDPDIMLVPMADGAGYDLTIEAASRIAGSLSARIALTLQREPLGTRLFWDGQVATSGLAKRLLAERKDQLRARV